jgi:hypothetical protein
MLVDDVTVSNQRIADEKMGNCVDTAGVFPAGSDVYVSIISDLEVDFRSLHKN